MVELVRQAGARLACGLVLLAMALGAPPAGAVDARAESSLALSYALYVSGVHVADISLRVDNSDSMSITRMSARTRGLVDRLVRYRGEMAAASQEIDGEVRPLHYEASYATRRYDRDVLLRFDPASGKLLEVENHKRGEPQEPRVADELQADTVDPLTAILQMRDDLEAAIAGGPQRFEKQVFDGRRRYDMKVVYLGRGQERLGGERRDVLRLELTLTPIAGFNRRDLLAGWTDDGQRVVEVLVSDDGRFVPLRLATRGGLIGSSALLTDYCAGEGCAPAGD